MPALWLLCAVPAAAQPAHMVEDLVTSTRPGGISAQQPTAFGPDIYFAASNAGSFEQLWMSEGVSGGLTRKLRDFDVLGSRGPSHFTATDTALFFFADRALWRIVQPTSPERVAGLPDDASSTAGLSHVVVFTIYALETGYRLWSSDGTAQGTGLIDAVPPGTILDGDLTRVDDAVEFLALGSGGLEIWKTDGSQSGTVRAVALGQTYSPSGGTAALGSLFLFVARDGSGPVRPWVLFRSDATPAGTFPLARFANTSADVCPGSCVPVGPSFLTQADGQVFFVADDGVHGRELWRTDGSVAGTRLLRDIGAAELPGVSFQSFVTAGRKAFFTANDGEHGAEVWVSDGTEAGTHLIADLFPNGSNPFPLSTLDDRALFLGRDGNDLWVTDGTDPGTLPVRDFDGYDGLYGFVPRPGETLFFQSAGQGSALWRTDGTPSGTLLVDPFETAEGSYPDLLTDLSAGRLAFGTGGGPYGGPSKELRSTDGTAEGTVLVGSFASIETGGAFRGTFFFSADDGEHGSELWKSDGAPGGAALVKDIATGALSDSHPHGFVPAGRLLFFAAFEPESGTELWATDGTEAGTRLVRDVRPGPDASEPVLLGAAGDRVVFMADDGVHGQEPWASDGTSEGTVLVRDILPGSTGSSFQDSTVALGRVFFGAYDGSTFDLWMTDGTSDGTSSLGPFDPHQLTAAGRLVYFTDVQFRTLWRSDGTAEGTFVIREGVQSLNLVGSTGLLYFVGDDGVHGLELWRSSGIAAGTRMVRDILPGGGSGMSSGGPYDFSLAAAGDLAVFSANDGEHGVELWSSDGSEEGTRMIQDIAPGATSSMPMRFTPSDGRVDFTADDGAHGRELWSVPVGALRPVHGRGIQPVPRPDRSPRELPERPSP